MVECGRNLVRLDYRRINITNLITEDCVALNISNPFMTSKLVV